MERSLVLAAAVVFMLTTAGPAGATARDAGSCSGRSDYHLAVFRDSQEVVKVRFRVTNSPPGDVWQLFGSDNGSRIFAVKKTASSEGSVSVGRPTADQPGTDAIKATAYNASSGETCRASVDF